MAELSTTSAIAALGLGESLAKAVRHDFSGTPIDSTTLAARVNKMRDAIQQPVARAAKRTGHSFVIESGVFFNRQMVPICTVVVTRREDGSPSIYDEAADL